MHFFIRRSLPIAAMAGVFFLLSGCSIKVVSTQIERTGNFKAQSIPQKLVDGELHVVKTDPENYTVRVSGSYATQERAEIKNEILKKEAKFYFMPVHSASLMGYKYDRGAVYRENHSLLKLFFMDIFSVGLVPLMDIIKSHEGVTSYKTTTNKMPLDYVTDTHLLTNKPISNASIEVTLPDTGERFQQKTDDEGNISLSLVEKLPAQAKDMRLQIDLLGENPIKLEHKIPLKTVAQWLKDYPRYPAILTAKATPMQSRLSPCGKGEISLTMTNKGKGRAVGVIVEALGGKYTLTDKVDVGAIEPGESKTVKLPLTIAANAQMSKERLTLEIRERLGNDAAPLKVEVPISGDRPEIAIRGIAYNDKATSVGAGNGNGRLENGEAFTVSAEVVNQGKSRAKEVIVSLTSKDATLAGKQTTLYDLAPGESRTVRLGASLDTCYKGKEVGFELAAALPETCFEPVQTAKTFPVEQSFPRFRSEFIVADGNRSGTRGNRNGRIDNGERIEVTVKVTNDGGAPARNTLLKVSSSDLPAATASRSLGDIPVGGTAQGSFTFDVPRLFSAKSVNFSTAIVNDNACGGAQSESIALTVGQQQPTLVADYKILDNGANANGNGVFEQGEECQIFFTVKNTGGLDAENVMLEIDSPSDDIAIPDRRKSLGTIPANGEPVVFSTSAFIKNRCTPKDYAVALKVTQSDFPTLTRSLPVAVAKAGESAVVAADIADATPAMRPGTLPSLAQAAPIVVVTDPIRNATLSAPDVEVVASVITSQGLKAFSITMGDGRERGISLKQKLENRQIIREKVRLAEGDNTITLTATDLAGVTTSETVRVRYEPAADFYGTTYALIIGIDSYKDKKIPGLRYAVADAKAVKNALIKQAGFRQENIIELYNEDATRDEIVYQLKDNLLNKVKPNDAVFFFFAGHGETIGGATGESGYLIAHNTRKDRIGSSGVPITEIEEASRVLGSRHNLFVLDSCFSGMAGSQTRSVADTSGDASTYVRKMMQKRGNQFITAGMRDEKVIESDRWKHSVFTYYLLKGLEGAADSDDNNVISASELSAYLKPRVTTESKGKQTPQLRFSGDEGEFMFRRPI